MQDLLLLFEISNLAFFLNFAAMMQPQIYNSARKQPVVGRFAPSPSGRMHLGNVYAALMSWLCAKAQGGKWLLRIEDLDPQRCRREYALQLEDDLRWMGLQWDLGGLGKVAEDGFPYCQSQRHGLYHKALEKLNAQGLIYPCKCSRAEIRTAQAPHASDGHLLYPGSCRPGTPQILETLDVKVNLRLRVADHSIGFRDIFRSECSYNPAHEHGDIVLRRADGAWAYQLAVVVDDAAMGVTQVVRGNDLLTSASLQLALYDLLGLEPPEFGHFALFCSPAGQRLSKRDKSLDMDVLRKDYRPQRLIGIIAHLCGLTDRVLDLTPENMLEIYTGMGKAVADVFGRERIIVENIG